jgi:hypothetical protein
VTLAAYAKIGYDHRDRAGERDLPAWAAQGLDSTQ